jgi:hypothetical protein
MWSSQELYRLSVYSTVQALAVGQAADLELEHRSGKEISFSDQDFVKAHATIWIAKSS